MSVSEIVLVLVTDLDSRVVLVVVIRSVNTRVETSVVSSIKLVRSLLDV